MLRLARETLVQVLRTGQFPEPQEVPAVAARNGACFVTLTARGALRGCMGNVLALEPLYKSLIRNARDAALHDPRLDPVRLEELEQVRIEVTVLGELEDLNYRYPDELLSQLRCGEHGVVLRIGCRMATFLPQMWTPIPDKVTFLDRLCEKAGCEASAWRARESGVSVFCAEWFHEQEVAL